MRIAVFIDYWNFQLTLNERVSQQDKTSGVRVKINWRDLGMILAKRACAVLGSQESELSYEGCYIYTSFNPLTEEGKKFKNWVSTWLDRQAGINVEARERRRKSTPRCPLCHKEITHCPHSECGQPIVATEEKGVDTLLVTDLLRLAHTGSYDVAVLASLDADMVPAVDYIQTLGKKIIQAGFPPKGMSLSTECWGSFDVLELLSQIRRP
jgi:uncharacterized LabA/DUF88 family protein